MLISKLLSAIGFKCNIKDCEIVNITDDSRKCREGSLFICREGGEDYVSDAVGRGAVCVIAKEKLCENTVVTDRDMGEVYALLCSAFFGDCHKSLRLIGVTGTNGKTTVATMIYTVLTMSGEKCGLISTVENKVCGEGHSTSLTTPDCFEIHSLMARMVEKGARYCVVEASSQGIAEKRLCGLSFDCALLTGVSHEHLDYHGTMENYVNAKKELFKKADRAFINLDSEYSDEFIGASSGKVITYSLKNDRADFTAKWPKSNPEGIDYALVTDYAIHRMKIPAPGLFNVANSLGAVAVCFSLGICLEACASALRMFHGVKGRMEILDLDTPYKVIIDFAHTPESLRQVLLSLKNFPHRRIITLFGCGGDRDEGKRPLMGKTACELSDVVIITADNPRHENPADIIDAILEGTKDSKTPVFIQENRPKAIEFALKTAAEDDIILLAGKGHETGQLIGDERIPMDERKIVREILSYI